MASGQGGTRKTTYDMKAKPKYISVLVASSLVFSATARAAIVLGGDFTPYKPASESITASYTGYVPWPSSVATPISPNSLTVSGGTATYGDSTGGPTVDFLGWTKPQGGADFVPNGIGGSSALNLFAAWGGSIRPIVETTGSLHTIGAGETITITTMVGGPSGGPKSGLFFFELYAGGAPVTPSSFVDQVIPLDEGFQLISRTYDAAALAAHVGETTKIRISIPDSNVIGNRIIFDDVSFSVVPEPSVALLAGIGLFASLRRNRPAFVK